MKGGILLFESRWYMNWHLTRSECLVGIRWRQERGSELIRRQRPRARVLRGVWSRGGIWSLAKSAASMSKPVEY